MRPYSDEKLLARLMKANSELGKIALSGKVKQMTYWESRKPYTLLRFLELIDWHIQSHTRGIRKKRKVRK